MYKIGHLSDCHIGYRTGSREDDFGVNLRERDGYNAFVTMIDDIVEQKPDCIVIAGDLFHTPTPSPRELVFVREQLMKLWAAGIPVYILAGNHEASDVESEVASSLMVNDPWRGIYSHVEPYVSYEVLPGVILHMVSHHQFVKQDATFSEIKDVPKDAINIFATHGSTLDPLTQKILHTEQSPREIIIPEKILTDYDWSIVMLGHIHERRWIDEGEDGAKMFYNGSLIRRGFTDKPSEMGRGWTLWTIGDDGSFTPEYRNIVQRPQYDFTLDCSDLDSKEITELVLNNLQSTQVDGAEYRRETAPILRQKLVGITSAKLGGLNMTSINEASKHAFSWNLQPVVNNPINAKTKDDSDEESCVEEVVGEGGDMSTLFEKWKPSSKTLNSLDGEFKAIVEKQTGEFLEQGVAAVFKDSE